MEVITIDDDMPRPSKRQRCLQRLLEQLDTTADEELALSLQIAEDGVTPTTASENDAALARLLQAEFDLAASDMGPAGKAQAIQGLVSDQDQQGELDVPISGTSPIHKARALQFIASNDLPDRMGARQMLVKVYSPDGVPIVVNIKPDAALSTLLTKAPVGKALRALLGVKRICNENLAKSFDISTPGPGAHIFDHSLASRTCVRDALGAQRVLHIQRNGSARASSHVARSLSSGCVAAPGGYDRVEVLRLRTPGDLGSPIVLVKNFNRDRGALLARLTGLREMVEMAPDARKNINDNVRNELDAHKKTRRNFTSEVRQASDRVLDIGQEAVKADVAAHAAIAHRTEYASTAVLVYDHGTTLPRHVDGCGHWVILLSFGVTVDFFAGDRSIMFESGDALIFNGSKTHAVMHGIDRLRKKASLRGKSVALPEELSYMSSRRASFQARQGDP